MTKNIFKLFPKKSSELPASGFAKHPCIKRKDSLDSKLQIVLSEINKKIRFDSITHYASFDQKLENYHDFR